MDQRDIKRKLFDQKRKALDFQEDNESNLEFRLIQEEIQLRQKIINNSNKKKLKNISNNNKALADQVKVKQQIQLED